MQNLLPRRTQLLCAKRHQRHKSHASEIQWWTRDSKQRAEHTSKEGDGEATPNPAELGHLLTSAPQLAFGTHCAPQSVGSPGSVSCGCNPRGHSQADSACCLLLSQQAYHVPGIIDHLGSPLFWFILPMPYLALSETAHRDTKPIIFCLSSQAFL